MIKLNTAIILAGGVGKRMGGLSTPKQFLDVYGKPIIVYTLEVFDNHPDIDSILIIGLKNWVEEIETIVKRYDIKKVIGIVEGGETRQESVYNGLKFLKSKVGENDIVLIHDSVRPLISQKIISNNINKSKKLGSINTVISSFDTIVKSNDGYELYEIPNRDLLYLGQTPQSFKFIDIFNAHENARKKNIMNATDDCKLILDNGDKVYLVEGDILNFKITSSEDLLIFKSIIKLGGESARIC